MIICYVIENFVIDKVVCEELSSGCIREASIAYVHDMPGRTNDYSPLAFRGKTELSYLLKITINVIDVYRSVMNNIFVTGGWSLVGSRCMHKYDHCYYMT